MADKEVAYSTLDEDAVRYAGDTPLHLRVCEVLEYIFVGRRAL